MPVLSQHDDGDDNDETRDTIYQSDCIPVQPNPGYLSGKKHRHSWKYLWPHYRGKIPLRQSKRKSCLRCSCYRSSVNWWGKVQSNGHKTDSLAMRWLKQTYLQGSVFSNHATASLQRCRWQLSWRTKMRNWRTPQTSGAAMEVQLQKDSE